MGSELPHGNDAPEQPKQPVRKSRKMLLPVTIGLLALAAVLVGVLPEWGEKDKESQDITASELKTGKDSTVSEARSFKSSNGPFNVTLPLFSTKVTEGYASSEELKHDLDQIAKFLLNSAITQNVEGGTYSVGDDVLNSTIGDAVSTTIGAGEGDSSKLEADSTPLDDVDDYGTNNQEFTIDRADFVKSDGNFIFAAYSDYLIVWATDGQGIITKIQMPPLNITGYTGCPVGVPCIAYEPMPVDGNSTNGSTGGETPSNSTGKMAAGDEAIGSYPTMWWNPKPRIEALLLHEDRLTVVISGYGTENSEHLGSVPVLFEYLGTKVQVYEINNGDLKKVSETDVNGSFRNAYSVNVNAYIVTQSTINTWDHLLAPVQRWQPQFAGLDDEEYLQAVDKLIDDGLVESFVDKLFAELQVNGEMDLARFSLFADSISADNVEESLFADYTGKAVTQVVAFDMTLGSSDSINVLKPHISGTFQPSSWGQVYAVSNMIIVADQGWSWMEKDNQAAQKTFLIGFRLDGPKSYHELIGSVPGYLLNPFSLDFVEKTQGAYLRIATTQSFWTPWVEPIGGDAADGQQAAEIVSEPESSTLNQIIVLKVTTDSNVLEQVGSLELGEPNEMFTAVRFFDDFAYAVTFEQTDPFYVVDLSNEQPIKAGELKVSGFSQYLHPIDDQDKFLVAIGQDADESGNILGLQISLFDATDPANPSLINRHLFEQEKNSYSSSAVSWDERAFRFLKLGERTGKLILPVSISTYQEFDEVTGLPLETPQATNFEGFSVFNIEDNQITKDFDIDHTIAIQNTGTACDSYYDWLPERSLVFNGAVMTMKMYTIVSTSLSTGETLWTLPINEALLGCTV